MMRKIYHEKDQWKIHNISNSRPTPEAPKIEANCRSVVDLSLLIFVLERDQCRPVYAILL